MQRTCLSPLGFEWPVSQAVAGTFMDVLIHTWDLARGRDRMSGSTPVSSRHAQRCSCRRRQSAAERPALSGRKSRSATTRHRRIGRSRQTRFVARDRTEPQGRNPRLRASRKTRHAATGLGRRATRDRTRRRRRSVPVGGQPAPEVAARYGTYQRFASMDPAGCIGRIWPGRRRSRRFWMTSGLPRSTACARPLRSR